MAGAAAAVVGGGIWALIGALTDREIGWVAWGIGLLTGFAMSRTSSRRGAIPAALAATFAAVGILSGKLLILEYVSRPAMVRALATDVEGMAVWDLRETRAFPPEVQARLDALAPSDTMPDVLWQEMVTAGKAHADSLSGERKTALRAAYASSVLTRVTLLEQLRWQFSLFDLLWFGLALTTAWQMLRPAKEAAPA